MTRHCAGVWGRRRARSRSRASPKTSCSSAWNRYSTMSSQPSAKSEHFVREAPARSRLLLRLAILARAAAQAVATIGRRHPRPDPRRILIAHRLLLGDTLMLTALIARLREAYPRAEI